ncbi:hypothetical protein DdX_16425 [Ditylenchus destructor]|uniref:Uncharacterized protein n=1 Tax=Ditylenchus destructor TaxID=166010 RepID=A0AAD4MNV7_9BILA|nr:hypothetical protein DdX_16425 [Ditylenchus destructor]
MSEVNPNSLGLDAEIGRDLIYMSEVRNNQTEQTAGINALKDALIILTNKIDDVVQQLSSQNEMLHRILLQTNYPQPPHVPYPSFQSHYQPTHNPVQFNTGIPPQFTQATRPFGTQPSQPSAMALKRRAQRERKKAKRLAEQQNNPKETTPANTTSILPTAPASIQPVAPPVTQAGEQQQAQQVTKEPSSKKARHSLSTERPHKENGSSHKRSHSSGERKVEVTAGPGKQLPKGKVMPGPKEKSEGKPNPKLKDTAKPKPKVNGLTGITSSEKPPQNKDKETKKE